MANEENKRKQMIAKMNETTDKAKDYFTFIGEFYKRNNLQNVPVDDQIYCIVEIMRKYSYNLSPLQKKLEDELWNKFVADTKSGKIAPEDQLGIMSVMFQTLIFAHPDVAK